MEDLKKVQEFFSRPISEFEGEELSLGDTIKINPVSFPSFEFPYGTEGEIIDISKADYASDDLVYRVKLRYIDGQGDEANTLYIENSNQYLNEQEEDPTDIIAMDVPLFLRMLEYAREDAEQDIDLHKVTERAIEAVKLRGLLSMDDYQDIIGEPIDEMTGYSKYLTTPENPKGKTQGLTQDVMDKILMKIATMGDDDVEETTRLGEGVIYEELCPKGKAYIKKRQAAGEKSSAYLSGRAVKVCKGQMKG
jgi:hypothetical protein